MKSKPAIPLSAEKFYDVASEFYEQMINFEKNMNLRIDAYKNIFPRKGTAVDLGCGIGLDSLALAKNDHNVIAFDISPKMIEAAKVNSRKYNLKINFKIGSVDSIPKRYDGKFNSLVCVGNTIAHLNKNELNAAFKKFHNLLLPQGKLFLHVLNYEKILKSNKRVNNIANREGKTIIRFYDFLKDYIQFNILWLETANPKEHKLITTKHFPHTQKEISQALKKAGFTKIKCYGTFDLEKYSPAESKDLFIEAIK